MIEGLYELAQQSLDILQSKKRKAAPTKIMMIKHKIGHFKVSENGFSITSSNKQQVKTDWTYFVYHIVEKDISNLETFQNVVTEITNHKFNTFNNIKPNEKHNQAKYWLQKFIQKILLEKIEGNLTQTQLFGFISMFENDLHNGPIQQKLISYICGLILEQDNIVLDDDAVLRQVIPSDLEYSYQIGTTPDHFTTEKRHPTAIIEIKMLVSRNESFKLVKKLEKLLLVLRLYNLGSIPKLRTEQTEETIIWSMGKSFFDFFGVPRTRTIDRYKYSLKTGEEKSLQSFYGVIEPLVKIFETEKNATCLSIALNRYQNAVSDQVDEEIILMTAMMGLEALFCLPCDRGEISYKLGLRAAKFLSHLGLDSKQIRNDITKAYSIRNRVAHGLVIKKNESQKITDLTKRITNLLRFSLILFLLIGASKINETINLIDLSMINDSSNQELVKRISSVKKKLPPEVFC